MAEPAVLFRLLGDDARLRLLRVLGRERLNVTELTATLGISQSGVSRHLGLLKEARLVTEEREAGYAFYRANRVESAGADPPDPLWTLLDAQFAGMERLPAIRADEARLQEVLRVRKENFDAHGTEVRQLVPGRSWAAWARALGRLLPPLVVADVGCGEGYLTIEIARWAESVIAVDRSREVLQRARELARRRKAGNITWKRGEIERLPIADGRVDLAVLSQALHHAACPAAALAEAARIVKPGGRVLVLDLRTHDQAWVKARLDDRWLGFADDKLAALLEDAGLDEVTVGVGARRTGDPFTVLIASGAKPR